MSQRARASWRGRSGLTASHQPSDTRRGGGDRLAALSSDGWTERHAERNRRDRVRATWRRAGWSASRCVQVDGAGEHLASMLENLLTRCVAKAEYGRTSRQVNWPSTACALSRPRGGSVQGRGAPARLRSRGRARVRSGGHPLRYPQGIAPCCSASRAICRDRQVGEETSDAARSRRRAGPAHCPTGCTIGEVLGMVSGTALGFS
jgi:hypothetical protein